MYSNNNDDDDFIIIFSELLLCVCGWKIMYKIKKS